MARSAGKRPNSSAVATVSASVKSTMRQSSRISPALGNAAAAWRNHRAPHTASSSPMAAPGSAAQTASRSRAPDHLGAARSQREAHGDFALPAAGLRQQQARHIGACDRQHQRHGAEQNPQRLAHAAHGLFLQRLDQRRPRGVGRRELERQTALNGGQVGLGGAGLDAFLDPPHRRVETRFALPASPGAEGWRGSHTSTSSAGKRKESGTTPTMGKPWSPKRSILPSTCGSRLNLRFQRRSLMTAAGGPLVTSSSGLNPRPTSGGRRPAPKRSAARSSRRPAFPEAGRKCRPGFRCRRPRSPRRSGSCGSILPDAPALPGTTQLLPRAGFVDGHQPVACGVGKGLEQNRVDDRKYRAVGADSERHRAHYSQKKRGTPDQAAVGSSNVRPHCLLDGAGGRRFGDSDPSGVARSSKAARPPHQSLRIRRRRVPHAGLHTDRYRRRPARPPRNRRG